MKPSGFGRGRAAGAGVASRSTWCRTMQAKVRVCLVGHGLDKRGFGDALRATRRGALQYNRQGRTVLSKPVTQSSGAEA